MAEQAIRITLSTGKVVIMRVPKIKHQEQAMRVVGKSAGDNQQLFQFRTGVELLKLCIAKIDEKEFSAQSPVDVDDDLSTVELSQLNSALEQFRGDADFLPKVEAVSIGE